MKMNKKLTGYPSIDKPWLKYYSDEAINAIYPKMNMRDYLFERSKKFSELIALSYLSF